MTSGQASSRTSVRAVRELGSLPGLPPGYDESGDGAKARLKGRNARRKVKNREGARTIFRKNVARRGAAEGATGGNEGTGIIVGDDVRQRLSSPSFALPSNARAVPVLLLWGHYFADAKTRDACSSDTIVTHVQRSPRTRQARRDGVLDCESCQFELDRFLLTLARQKRRFPFVRRQFTSRSQKVFGGSYRRICLDERR